MKGREIHVRRADSTRKQALESRLRDRRSSVCPVVCRASTTSNLVGDRHCGRARSDHRGSCALEALSELVKTTTRKGGLAT